VFAFRALAATGLMNPFGSRSYNFTYEDDTTRTDKGWRIGFAASECEPRKAATGYSFTCTGLSGDHPESGNALTDTFLTVRLENKEWTVVGVEGNMLDRERDRVIGYKSAQREEPSHWEFPAVGAWPTGEGVYSEAMALWVGPYPTSAPGSVCEFRAADGGLEVIQGPKPFYVEPPKRPFERAGWIRGVDGLRVGGDSQVTVHCEQYTGRGWEVASGPEIIGSTGEALVVTAELVWRGAKGFTTAAVCHLTLEDQSGQVIWEGSEKVEALWRPSELKDYPYRSDVVVDTGVANFNSVSIRRFNCASL
jgi:hypothetical protein